MKVERDAFRSSRYTQGSLSHFVTYTEHFVHGNRCMVQVWVSEWGSQDKKSHEPQDMGTRNDDLREAPSLSTLWSPVSTWGSQEVAKGMRDHGRNEIA